MSRKETFTGPVDDAFETLGLKREIVAVVPGFPDAPRIVRQSELIALVPRSCLGSAPLADLAGFEFPIPTPEIKVSEMWHPHMDADPAYRWLRDTVTTVCRTAVQS